MTEQRLYVLAEKIAAAKARGDFREAAALSVEFADALDDRTPRHDTIIGRLDHIRKHKTHVIVGDHSPELRTSGPQMEPRT